MRWLAEAWRAAQTARGEGIAVKAVTVWSLLGTTDWNSLLVTKAGHYECGAFDVRTTPPRVTALGAAVAELCETGGFDHPALARPGWWRSEEDGAGEAMFSVQGDEVLVMALRAACEVRRLTLGPRPLLGVIRAERSGDGRTVLDVGAAPGGKTMQLAAAVGERAKFFERPMVKAQGLGPVDAPAVPDFLEQFVE